MVLGTFDELARNGVYVNELNMSKYARLTSPTQSVSKIRYNDAGAPTILEQQGDTIKFSFENGVHAIALGQAAVFYGEDDVIGGGWIQSAFQESV